MKQLEGLRWRHYMTAHLGCVHGCLDYLGADVSKGWLFGGTAHAFIINFHPTACPSGPTAWATNMLFQLAPNVGYRAEGIKVCKWQAGESFHDAQRQAFDLVRAAIDAGTPCYGWQFEAPDFYVIKGYDEVGYYYSGWDCDEGKGPLAWDRLGDWDVEIVEAYAVRRCEPAPAETVVRDAVAAALKFASGPPEWVQPGYVSGPAAFDVWAEAVGSGNAQRDGHAYNAEVWHECRAMAVDFLREAAPMLPPRCSPPLEEAAARYAVARDRLAEAKALHPMRPDADYASPLRNAEVARLLCDAGQAERQALAALERLAAALR